MDGGGRTNLFPKRVLRELNEVSSSHTPGPIPTSLNSQQTTFPTFRKTPQHHQYGTGQPPATIPTSLNSQPTSFRKYTQHQADIGQPLATMSFHTSAENIRVEDDHILKAELLNEDGEPNETEIDLNEFLGNNDGAFEWGGQGLSTASFTINTRVPKRSSSCLLTMHVNPGFSDTAEEITFSVEGDDNVPVLHARLFNVEGEPINADCNLAERIGNDNGSFVFQ